jgi:hypothetical protein
MQYIKIAVPFFLLLFTNGCLGTDSHSKQKPTLKMRLLYEGSQCSSIGLEPHAIWIKDPDQFEKTYARLSGQFLSPQQDLSARVDFSREGILIVAMGQKPTGGYGLELDRDYADLSNDTAILRVSWIEPPKDAILPQIITSPCLAIVLPKGPYSKIHLLDQDGGPRLQLLIE